MSGNSKPVYSTRAPQAVGNYPHARSAGGFLYLSGIGPRNPQTNEIPKSFEEQCVAVFDHVATILQDAGYEWTELLDITVFLTDMKSHFDVFNKLYASRFAENPPCRTTVEVNALPTPIQIELKCVAYREQTGS